MATLDLRTHLQSESGNKTKIAKPFYKKDRFLWMVLASFILILVLTQLKNLLNFELNHGSINSNLIQSILAPNISVINDLIVNNIENKEYAYAMLIDTIPSSYFVSILSFYYSLKKHGSKYPLIGFYTMRRGFNKLAFKYLEDNTDIILQQIDNHEIETSLNCRKCSPHTFYKLSYFKRYNDNPKLKYIKTILTVDCDMVLTKNIDFFFEMYSPISMSVDARFELEFNTGVMIISPNNLIYDYLIKHLPFHTDYNGYLVHSFDNDWLKIVNEYPNPYNKSEKLTVHRFALNSGTTDQGYINAMFSNKYLLTNFMKYYMNLKLVSSNNNYKDLLYLKNNFKKVEYFFIKPLPSTHIIQTYTVHSQAYESKYSAKLGRLYNNRTINDETNGFVSLWYFYFKKKEYFNMIHFTNHKPWRKGELNKTNILINEFLIQQNIEMNDYHQQLISEFTILFFYYYCCQVEVVYNKYNGVLPPKTITLLTPLFVKYYINNLQKFNIFIDNLPKIQDNIAGNWCYNKSRSY